MIGIIGGLSAAIFWCGAGTCSARLARSVGSLQALALGNIVGFVALVAIALVWVGPPDPAGVKDVLIALAYGIGTVGGLAAIFRAYELTKLGLTSAMVAANGSVAALASVLFLNESLPVPAWVALVVVGLGISVVALASGGGARLAGGGSAKGIGFAALGALGFGLAVAAASAADTLHPVWIVAAGRLVGLVVVTIPLMLAGRLPRPERALWPYVVGSPFFDAAGFIAVLIGSRDGVAIPAVLSNLSCVLLVAVGAVAFHERLTPLQLSGATLTLLGVVALTLLRGG